MRQSLSLRSRKSDPYCEFAQESTSRKRAIVNDRIDRKDILDGLVMLE